MDLIYRKVELSREVLIYSLQDQLIVFLMEQKVFEKEFIDFNIEDNN